MNELRKLGFTAEISETSYAKSYAGKSSDKKWSLSLPILNRVDLLLGSSYEVVSFIFDIFDFFLSIFDEQPSKIEVHQTDLSDKNTDILIRAHTSCGSYFTSG